MAPFLVAMLVLLAAPRCEAETDLWGRISERVSLSASDRVRGEYVSWFEPVTPGANETYGFFANRLRAGATVDLPVVEIVVEGQDTRLVSLPGSDAIAPGVGPLGPGAVYFANTRTRDQGEVFLRRAYATLHDFGLSGVKVRGGRFGYNLGAEKVAADPTLAWLQKSRIAQRLIGEFEYTHVGRGFDGLQGIYDSDAFNFTATAGFPTQGGFNVNANTHIEDIEVLAGVATLLGKLPTGPLSGQFFTVYYRDRRDLVATDNRPLTPPADCAGVADDFRSCDGDDIAIMTVGGNLTHAIEVAGGRADFLLWGAGQVGDWESLDHEAWAYAIETGYQRPDLPAKPWARLGFFRSSGDDDAGDGDHQTFFQILPTSRIYAEFPFFNLMNSQELFVQLLTKPLAELGVNLSAHWLRVTEGADLWYSGGGATSSTFFGYAGVPARRNNELAYLVDLSVTYAPIRHLQLYAYYGHAFGQGAVSANFAGDDADYGYLEATLSL